MHPAFSQVSLMWLNIFQYWFIYEHFVATEHDVIELQIYILHKVSVKLSIYIEYVC